MKSVWISAGGNVGDVCASMASALHDIDSSKNSHVKSVSSIYLSKAWGNEDQDDFLNITFEAKTSLEPENLLQFLQQLEMKYKRERLIKWGPRTLDLDLLVYEGVEDYHSEVLTLPHPFITQRNFVLDPLYEIAPLLTIKDKTVKEWSKTINHDGIIKLDTKDNWWKVFLSI